VPRKLNREHLRILALLKEHAEQGISQVDIEKKLGLAHSQSDRRRRELNSQYLIEGKNVEVSNAQGETIREYRYFYKGIKETPLDSDPINLRLRAEARAKARGRCGMCGRTIEEDHIKLVVDHKIPREWGGKTESDNLWAICEECNHGKKNHFAHYDQDVMKRVMHHKSVHVRIGELLKAFEGEPVPGDLIEFVANQDDWKKRTRELRYLGWKVIISKKKLGSRVKSFYAVKTWKEWPSDPTASIRRYEAVRAERNRQSK